MTILFFSIHVKTPLAVRKWLLFFDTLGSRVALQIVFVTETADDMERVHQELNGRAIIVTSLDHKRVGKRFSEDDDSFPIDLGTKKYVEAIGKSHPTNWIRTQQQKFSTILTENEVDHVCLAVDEPYNSPLYLILEQVTRSKRIGTSLIKCPAFRCGIFDGLTRSSKEIQRIYKRKVAGELSTGERLKVDDFCKGYRRLTTSEPMKSILYQHSYSGSNLFWKSLDFVRRLLLVRFETIPDGVDYYLLLLGKRGGYRQFITAANFLDRRMVLEKLVDALPKDTWLVVKDHPHSLKGAIDYGLLKEIRKANRVCYVDPNTYSTDELIKNSLAVITSASSVVIDALVQRKPIAVLGENPELVNVTPDVVHRVERLKDLPDIYQKLTEDLEPPKRIDAFLFAFLSHTFLRHDRQETDWGRQPDPDKLRGAEKYTEIVNYGESYAHYIERIIEVANVTQKG